MKIVIKEQPRATISSFADKHRLVMEVYERDPKTRAWNTRLKRYTASFDGVELVYGNLLEGTFGEGDTVGEAIEDYQRRISGQRIKVRGSYIDVPILVEA